MIEGTRTKVPCTIQVHKIACRTKIPTRSFRAAPLLHVVASRYKLALLNPALQHDARIHIDLDLPRVDQGALHAQCAAQPRISGAAELAGARQPQQRLLP